MLNQIPPNHLNKMPSKQYTITKKIAKHGKQAVILIPKVLEQQLKPGTIAEIKINVLEDNRKEDE